LLLKLQGNAMRRWYAAVRSSFLHHRMCSACDDGRMSAGKNLPLVRRNMVSVYQQRLHLFSSSWLIPLHMHKCSSAISISAHFCFPTGMVEEEDGSLQLAIDLLQNA
jgi:hypothetical protein